jgi:hypothetical protein
VTKIHILGRSLGAEQSKALNYDEFKPESCMRIMREQLGTVQHLCICLKTGVKQKITRVHKAG